jgi:hypothetical protein
MNKTDAAERLFWLAAVILLLATAAALAVSAAALAQEPTEARKSWALKRAYQINDYSMVGWGSIDLSNEQPDALVIRTIPIKPEKNDGDDQARHLRPPVKR